MTSPQLSANKPAHPVLVIGITLIAIVAVGGLVAWTVGLGPLGGPFFDFVIAAIAAWLVVTESRAQEDDFSWKSLTPRAVFNGLIAVIALARSEVALLLAGYPLLALGALAVFSLPFVWRTFIGLKAYRRSFKHPAYLDERGTTPSTGATLLIVLGVLVVVLLPFLKRAQK